MSGVVEAPQRFPRDPIQNSPVSVFVSVLFHVSQASFTIGYWSNRKTETRCQLGALAGWIAWGVGANNNQHGFVPRLCSPPSANTDTRRQTSHVESFLHTSLVPLNCTTFLFLNTIFFATDDYLSRISSIPFELHS